MHFWERIPKALMAWITAGSLCVGLLGGAFAAGAATSGSVEEFKSIPPRVMALEAHEAAQDSLIARVPTVDTLSASNRAIALAVLDSMSSLSSRMGEVRCYVRAMALDREPSRDCSKLLTGMTSEP